ncbi:MAG: chaperone modulator CbpM [Pseudomonadota bacterium]
MLITIEEIVTEFKVSRQEVTTWIAQRWVLPVEDPRGQMFNEADRARIALITELRRDLQVGDEVMPMVLRLLDQVYTLRRTLGELNSAIDGLPEDSRAALKARLRKLPKS